MIKVSDKCKLGRATQEKATVWLSTKYLRSEIDFKLYSFFSCNICVTIMFRQELFGSSLHLLSNI